MGIEIDRSEFAPGDYQVFRDALRRNMDQLDALLLDPAFGQGPASMGAELEMYIVDSDGSPLSINQELQDDANDPQLTLELNRYNLEYNLTPALMSAGALAATEREILDKLVALRALAAQRGGRIVPIGILPTLEQSDFGAHCVTDRKRYHALVAQLIKRRGSAFSIDIEGDEAINLAMADITLEGANTSFQVHYAVAPDRFADTFNAVQLVSSLVLAVGSNSPTLFGHNLWHETRIPLFKQSIDTRQLDRFEWHEPARVNFGHGWVRHGAGELFREVAQIYPPLLPICAPGGDPAGAVPSLAELRLHQSTVWLWNRPVYDDANGGHLRIEMRALPAGPTAVDMVANAALFIGLAEGLRPTIESILPGQPFHMAEFNFYRAAQRGLDAALVWPRVGGGCGERPVRGLLQELLPTARGGLLALEVDEAEADYYLGIIAERLEARQTGAIWQRRKLAALERGAGRKAALHELLESYMQLSEQNLPVARWPV